MRSFCLSRNSGESNKDLERFYSVAFHYSKVTVPAAPSGPVQLLHFNKSSNKIDDGAAMDHAGKVERVPIGEPNTTVRLCLADLFRGWRAVDPIARRSQVDPDEPDRIFRPRLDRELAVGLDALEAETGS